MFKFNDQLVFSNLAFFQYGLGIDKDIIQGSELVVSKDNHDSTNVLTYSDYQKTLEQEDDFQTQL